MPVINTNSAALFATQYTHNAERDMSISMERLSSGRRINSAADDAAGSAISERMNTQIKGLDMSVRNANDGISLLQTTDGALEGTTDILQRMRELSVQSANDTNTSADRIFLQKEISQLQSELANIADNTEFNTQNLIDGSFGTKKIHIGANDGQTMDITIGNFGADKLGNHEYKADGDMDTVAVTGPAYNEISTSGSAANNAILAQTLKVGGHAGSADVTIVNYDSAAEVVAKVNAESSSTGVTASATTTVELSNLTALGNVAFQLSSDGADSEVTIAAAIADEDDLTQLMEAVNAKSGETGIQATLNSTKDELTLTHQSGEDIKIEDFTHTDNGDVTVKANGELTGITLLGSSGSSLNDTVAAGTITYSSNEEFTLESSVGASAGSVMGAGNSSAADASTITDGVANAAQGSGLVTVGDINISSQTGAEAALKVLDGALGMVENQRADLGAWENRLESSVRNMENVSTNTSAAKSRIMDADFAAESTSLAKNKILQQAGMAMLAQANQMNQGVMQLLQ